MKNDGGPAFPGLVDTGMVSVDPPMDLSEAPRPPSVVRPVFGTQDGMSLRDYIAIKVLAGMVAHSGRYGEGYEGEAAHQAYAHADAMLAERERD